MHHTIQFKTTSSLFLIPLLLACFAFLQKVQAVTPAPDGGYPSGNTAEGEDALFSRTTGAWDTAIGNQALFSNTQGNSNTAMGIQALFTNNVGEANTATGVEALFSNTEGLDNTADGYQALFSNDEGSNNTATGIFALFSNTGGNANTAVGADALGSNDTGSRNIALGSEAGSNVGTGAPGDDNIEIGNVGGGFDTGTIRIGTQGTQGAAFIAGVAGVFQSGTVDFVTINADGQLGSTVVSPVSPVSSRRFKKEIKPMDKTSEAILAFKPVTFRYKSDDKGTPQFGLIAEEVAEVNPDLVTRDNNGEIYAVRYEAVNAMLLNEFLKEHKAFLAERRKVQKQEAAIAELKSGIKALVATVKEQSSQIQKVSAQLEVRKPSPQTVLNNQ